MNIFKKPCDDDATQTTSEEAAFHKVSTAAKKYSEYTGVSRPARC